MGKNKKNRIDVVYSTNPNFSFDHEEEEEQETLEPREQLLYVSIDRSNAVERKLPWWKAL